MKNITVSLDDEVYRRARIKAAELSTSVSALVKKYLVELAGQESDFERRRRLEHELVAKIKGRGFSANDRLSRDEVHDPSRLTLAGHRQSAVSKVASTE